MDSLQAVQQVWQIANGDYIDVPAFDAGDDGDSLVWDAGSGAFAKATLATSAALAAHIADAGNPHAVTAAEVGAYTIANADSAIAAAVSTHAGAADPHTGYLLATGSRAGASSQAQTFTAGIRSPKIIAIADSTNAGGWCKADGTTQDVYYDSTYGRVGIGTSPSAPLHIVSSSQDEVVRFGNGVRDIILKMNNGAGTGNLFKSSNVGAKILYEFGDEYFGIHNGSAAMGHKAYDASGNGLKFLVQGQSAYGDYYAAYTGTRIGLRVSYPTASWIQFVVKGATSQTANLQEWQDSAAGIQFAVGAAGQLKTNQSATNTNTPSGATAHQLPIYNASGTLLGYIPIYASAWT